MIDEKTEVEETQPAEPSTAETKQSETVPYERFQEVVIDKNALKDSVKTLTEKVETLENQQVSEDEQTEPSTWKEAGDYATKRAYDQIQGEMKTKSEADAKVAGELKTQVEAIRGMGHKISKDEETTILGNMIEKNQDLVSATNEFLSERVKSEKATQQKEEGFVPPTGGGSDSGVGRLSYEELKKTSMSTLIQKAADAQKK